MAWIAALGAALGAAFGNEYNKIGQRELKEIQGTKGTIFFFLRPSPSKPDQEKGGDEVPLSRRCSEGTKNREQTDT